GRDRTDETPSRTTLAMGSGRRSRRRPAAAHGCARITRSQGRIIGVFGKAIADVADARKGGRDVSQSGIQEKQMRQAEELLFAGPQRLGLAQSPFFGAFAAGRGGPL